MPSASVIVSTYNQPRFLELVLLGYARQSTDDFELIIADDGSAEETRAVMERFAAEFPVPLKHSWQPDEGFRKARGVNLGVLDSVAPLLIFSDGDCIPERRFVERHQEVCAPNRFVVGGHVRMSAELTREMTPDDVRNGAFELVETPAQRRERLRVHYKNLLYIALRKRRKPKFYGLNFSVDRDSFFAVNGFDMTYTNSARDDSDLRNRMRLAGVRPKSLWHRSVVYHLDHPRHQKRDGWAEQDEYYHRRDLEPRAPLGLEELAAEQGVPLGAR